MSHAFRSVQPSPFVPLTLPLVRAIEALLTERGYTSLVREEARDHVATHGNANGYEGLEDGDADAVNDLLRRPAPRRYYPTPGGHANASPSSKGGAGPEGPADGGGPDLDLPVPDDAPPVETGEDDHGVELDLDELLSEGEDDDEWPDWTDTPVDALNLDAWDDAGNPTRPLPAHTAASPRAVVLIPRDLAEHLSSSSLVGHAG